MSSLPVPMSLTSSTPSRPVHVLVVGAGHVGSAVLDALTSGQFQGLTRPFLLVRPITMDDSVHSARLTRYKERGVTLIRGDLCDSVLQLTQMLQSEGIQAVVATTGVLQSQLQLPLVTAAKAAGVEHFIPSEFGIETHSHPGTGSLAMVVQTKQAVQRAIKEAGMDYTLIYLGQSMEYLLGTDFLGVDVAGRIVTAYGSWSACMNTASFAEAGIVAAACLLDPAARNAHVYLGERVTYTEIADVLDKVLQTKVQRKLTTVDEAEIRLQHNPRDRPAMFVSVIAEGIGTNWPVTQTYLALHPQHGEASTLMAFAETMTKGKATGTV